jgi:hypothetical protein
LHDEDLRPAWVDEKTYLRPCRWRKRRKFKRSSFVKIKIKIYAI